MPVPMMVPTPKSTRSTDPRRRRSRRPGSSVSAIHRSTDFVARSRLAIATPDARWTRGGARGNRQSRSGHPHALIPDHRWVERGPFAYLPPALPVTAAGWRICRPADRPAGAQGFRRLRRRPDRPGQVSSGKVRSAHGQYQPVACEWLQAAHGPPYRAPMYPSPHLIWVAASFIQFGPAEAILLPGSACGIP